MATGFSGSSGVDTLTVVLDVNGDPKKVVSPSSNGVSLTVKELLQFAGREHWLDEQQKELGRNYKEGAALPYGPVGRLTGIEVTLRITCYNSGNVPNSLT